MASSVSEILGEPTPLLIAGRVCKIRRLSVAEVMATMEREVLDEYVARMKEIAATLSDSDRVEYLVRMTQEAPSGTALSMRAAQRLGSIVGIVRLFGMALVPEYGPDGKPLPVPDIVVATHNNKPLVASLTKAMVGIEVKEVGKENPLPPMPTAP